MSGKRSLMGMTLLVFGLSWLYPLWPREQALHSSLTVVGLILLYWHDRRAAMTVRAYALVCLFIAAHCLAARWLYSNVPYDRWMDAMFGWSPGQAWGVTRNHTDRLIHLLYGVCLTPALVEWLARRYAIAWRQAAQLAVLLVVVSSVAYEWFEWLIAITLSPQDAEAYNGQQGDMWDAHKDMLLATIGALCWWPFYRHHEETGYTRRLAPTAGGERVLAAR
ncbi:DUF2238 domain-containing protein [Chitinimonas sp. JJ19]|uniref:DUF2238 domain-containing protein n=1 Tax=Chitinimonas sp. JJ19 TaxID=3109352 RepID=UPI00300280FD